MLMRVCSVFVLFSLLAPTPAAACICEPPKWKTFDEAVTTYDAVFIGRAEKSEFFTSTVKASVSTNGGAFHEETVDEEFSRITFEITKIYKGIAEGTKTIDISAATGGKSMCPFGFTKGAEYIVFAEKDGDKLSTGFCDPTRAWKDAKEIFHIK